MTSAAGPLDSNAFYTVPDNDQFMKRIALIGPRGAGKSLLAYTFSAFLKHRPSSGHAVAVVNLDPSVHKPAYVPDLDVRHFSRDSDVALLYPALFKDDVFSDRFSAVCQQSGAVLLDCASGLDWVWFSKLPSDFCDAAWLVSPALASESLMAALGEALDVPVINVVNTRELFATEQKTLSPFSIPSRSRKDTVFVNAWERDGFDALAKHLGPLPQTA
ncbi:ATP/GTP-binding protein [Candidatus Micrarchaeota archaeon]|nr:ATP/GTP-binding protein [Candidatus Micrarchaeota archaeon]